MSLWTHRVDNDAGTPITIPGLNFIPREDEGFLDIMYGPYAARDVPPVYDCGPYTITIFKDGAQFGTPVRIANHSWRSCWWTELTPAVVIYDRKYLIDNGYVPPYGDTGMPVAWPVSGSTPFRGPMTLVKDEAGYEPTTGGRPGIGIARASTAAWLSGYGTDQNMLECAKCTATQPIWDYDARKVYDLIARPFLTNYYSTAQGAGPDWLGPHPVDPSDIRPIPNPMPWTNPSSPQTAHMEEVCGIAALATGAGRYIRGVQMRVVRGFDADNAGSAWFNQATAYNNEMRGIAWLLRELFYAYWATKMAEDLGTLPADCLPSSNLKQIIDNQAAHFHAKIENDIWFQTYGTIYGGQIAFWQCDMVNEVLALFAGKWPAQWGPIYVKVFKNLAARINADGLDQWPVASPTWYWGLLGDDASSGHLVPYPEAVGSAKPYAELWKIWSAHQVAGTDPSGNNGWVTPAQVAALNLDHTNGMRFTNPSEYESWLYGAIAFAVFWDTHAGNGAMSAAYPRLKAAFDDVKLMLTKAGGPIPQAAITIDAKPLALGAVVVAPPPSSGGGDPTPPAPPLGDPVYPVSVSANQPVPESESPVGFETPCGFNAVTSKSAVKIDLTGRIPPGFEKLVANVRGNGIDTVAYVIWPGIYANVIKRGVDTAGGGQEWAEVHASGNHFRLYGVVGLFFNDVELLTAPATVPPVTPPVEPPVEPPVIPPVEPPTGEPPVTDTPTAAQQLSDLALAVHAVTDATQKVDVAVNHVLDKVHAMAAAATQAGTGVDPVALTALINELKADTAKLLTDATAGNAA